MFLVRRYLIRFFWGNLLKWNLQSVSHLSIPQQEPTLHILQLDHNYLLKNRILKFITAHQCTPQITTNAYQILILGKYDKN